LGASRVFRKMTFKNLLLDIKKVQRRVAYGSIGSSTLRNQGAPGVSEVAHNFLIEVNLNKFRDIENATDYLKILNNLTDELSKKFPDRAKGNWGAARKALNVFMEEVFYNKFLNAEYGFNRLGPFLEVPIDSYVIKNLKKEAVNKTPTWRGIKNLTPNDNMKWQEIASEVAEKRRILRIYLDIEYWRSWVP